MKKLAILLAAGALFLGTAVSAQDEVKDYHFKPYGFIRNYAFFDSRATKSLTEDMFFFLPLDENVVGGNDVNAVSSYNFQAITTRLGLDVLGYEINGVKMGGKIEGDFYCLSGTVGVFRMRQAYMTLGWDKSSLLIGQTWHPMAADMAHCINLETAAPFSPFNRSAQIQYNLNIGGGVSFTGALIENMQYISNGPDGKTNKYQRHAIPEIYAGLSFKKGGFLGRAGVDILTLRPHYGYESKTGKKYDEWFMSYSPFLYLQYTAGDFQIKAKTTYGQAADNMQMNSGYAVCGIKADGISAEYTPFQNWTSFLSAQYKLSPRWTLMGMAGYHKNLGTIEAIYDGNDNGKMDDYYFSSNGFANIDSIIRFTPTVMYTLGRFQFAVEYDFTTAAYGTLDHYGMVSDAHNVTNHRILTMVKFNL